MPSCVGISDGHACETIDLLRCDPSIFYVDPCDCQRYFKCVNYEIVPGKCSEETLWDTKNSNCGHLPNILLYDNCDEPWTRCNVTETRLSELQALCTNTSTIRPTTTLGVDVTSDGDGINAGLVIGLIVAGAVLAAIVIAAVFFYLRHKKKTAIKKGRRTIATNPEYFEGGNENDPYDFINDTHMNDPTYRGQSAGFPSNGTLSTSVHTGTLGSDVVYDNSASRDAVPSAGYTDTLRAAQEREQPYERLARDSNGNEIVPNAPDDKKARENRGFVNDDSAIPSVSDHAEGRTTRADSTISGGVASSTQKNHAPDYYTLTREST